MPTVYVGLDEQLLSKWSNALENTLSYCAFANLSGLLLNWHQRSFFLNITIADIVIFMQKQIQITGYNCTRQNESYPVGGTWKCPTCSNKHSSAENVPPQRHSTYFILDHVTCILIWIHWSDNLIRYLIYNVCTKLFMAFVLDLTATITITKMNILLEVDSVTCFFYRLAFFARLLTHTVH